MDVKNLIGTETRKTLFWNWLVEYNVPNAKELFDWLCSTDYFEAPASTKYHNNYPGGLFDHCWGVFRTLQWMTDKEVTKPWQRDCSPLIIGMLHDATKIDCYQLTDEGYIYQPKSVLSENHGEDSLLKLKEIMELTPEESYCIRYHMGAYDKENWAGYDNAIRAFPNVLWTHTADMVSSKLMED